MGSRCSLGHGFDGEGAGSVRGPGQGLDRSKAYSLCDGCGIGELLASAETCAPFFRCSGLRVLCSQLPASLCDPVLQYASSSVSRPGGRHLVRPGCHPDGHRVHLWRESPSSGASQRDGYGTRLWRDLPRQYVTSVPEPRLCSGE